MPKNRTPLQELASAIERQLPPSQAERSRLWMEMAANHLEQPGSLIDEICAYMEQFIEASGYPAGPTWALVIKGWKKLKHGENEAARQLLQQAYETFEEWHDLKGQTRALNGIGVINLYNNLFDHALEVLMRARQLAVSIGWAEMTGVIDSNMGLVYLKLNQPAEAARCLEAAKASPEIAPLNLTVIDSHLATAWAELGREQDAEKLLLDTLAYCQAKGFDISGIDARGRYGRLLRRTGRHQDAMVAFDAALLAARSLDNKRLIVDYGIELGISQTETGQLEAAATSLSEACALADSQNLPAEKSRALQALATVHQRSGAWQLAWQAEHEAAELAARAFNEKVSGQAASAGAERAASESAASKVQMRQLSLIAEIGREIAGAMDLESIGRLLYKNISSLMPADGFGLALFLPRTNSLDFAFFIEDDAVIPPFTLSSNAGNSLAAYCVRTGQDLRIGDIHGEYKKYVTDIQSSKPGADPVRAILYCPVRHKDAISAIITVQSHRAGAYEQHHLEILRAVCSYVAVALENARLFAEIKTVAGTDPLTGALNRRRFMEIFTAEADRVRRYGSDLSFVIFDLDFFKKVNDGHGHAAGDLVLKAAADRGAKALRSTDIIARYGGEEFVLLLPNTGVDGAMIVAERIRQSFCDNPVILPNGAAIAFSASFGLTGFCPADSFDSMAGRADKALYFSKDTGRNKVAKERCPSDGALDGLGRRRI